MLIDWFTTGAQIVNFLVLVFLLRRFLYGPIISAMDKRQAEIAGRLADAESQRRETELEADSYRRMNADLAARREELLTKAEREAESRRRALILQARVEVEEMKARWRGAIRQEQESFLQDLRRRTSEEIYAIARRALADLADADLEETMVRGFLRRLGALRPPELAELADSTGSNGVGILLVRSAFPLSVGMHQEIRQALQDLLDLEVQVEFETTPALIAGIELKSSDHKVAWHLNHYLKTLEAAMVQALETESYEEGQHEAQPEAAGSQP